MHAEVVPVIVHEEARETSLKVQVEYQYTPALPQRGPQDPEVGGEGGLTYSSLQVHQGQRGGTVALVFRWECDRMLHGPSPDAPLLRLGIRCTAEDEAETSQQLVAFRLDALQVTSSVRVRRCRSYASQTAPIVITRSE